MARLIPQHFIDDLIARADVVDVVGTRVTLKKAGSNYKGLCPFHDEKTPSFTVSPSKGFYHCFGCDAHGTALGFLMSYDNLSFPEAVQALADRLGLEVPAEAGEDSPRENGALFDLLAEADQIYRRALRENRVAIDYLKQRGIDGATAARFGIGYAPKAWSTLLDALGTSDARIALLEQAGLIVHNEQGRRYDRFRERIIFPIRDARGRVLGFGGRVLAGGEPKYLNSPETAVFQKGRNWYGLYEARQRPGRPEQVVVVEGYLDVIALAQFGIEPSVATLGTATSAEHLKRLTRLTDRIVFCFDGDAAGRAAAWRALETALPFGGGNVELMFLLLDGGEDPDTLVRSRGPEAFRALVDQAVPLSTFLIDGLRERVDTGSADGRSRLVTLAAPMLGRLPDGVYRQILIDEVSRVAGLAPARLEGLLEAPRRAREAPPEPPPTEAAEWARPAGASRGRSAPRDGRGTFIRRAINLVLHYPAAAAAIGPPDELEGIDQPGADLLLRLIEIARDNPHITTAGLVERFRGDELGRHLDKLAAHEPIDDEAAAPNVLRDSLRRVAEAQIKRKAAAAVMNRRSTGLS